MAIIRTPTAPQFKRVTVADPDQIYLVGATTQMYVCDYQTTSASNPLVGGAGISDTSSVVAGAMRRPQVSWCVPSNFAWTILDTLIMPRDARGTLIADAQLVLTTIIGRRSRLILAGNL